MFIPSGNPPIHGTSFARIAAEMGLTAPRRSRRDTRAEIPTQRSSRSNRVEVAAR